jgi:glycosyltransferase involved in cell wall biosynthesis
MCHIFIHFFEIGGGETYLHNFNKNAPFKETIFLNKNYINNTLHSFDCNIIYYNNYNELNNLLKENDYDIIIDHQLYWYENDLTLQTFKDIEKNKIIRITHGVPIHFKDISNLNYYYSIELYNELKSHVSWNNHIKTYINIGVDLPLQNKLNINVDIDIDNSFIKIAIIGRINEEKIPKDFLKSLTEFLKIYKKYYFNFYGSIDNSYKNYFLFNIKNNNNIKYHGIINPIDIENVYLENDILMHPSKNEAGATVVLEAMSYGLPVIAKNVSGLINALNNQNFLCNNDKDMFLKLLSINSNNYLSISKNNIEKIINENNKKLLLQKLYDEIYFIYLQSKIKNIIPNIIHYVYGLKKQTYQFPFVYYISILSNIIINKPTKIYFHYQYLPYGKWWDNIKKHLSLNYINCTELYWKDKKIVKYAHKADKIRMDILYKYGGIYMDIDTIAYKSYKNLLNNEFVIGLQEENYGEDKITLYCNAILFSVPNSIFLKKWLDLYYDYFDPNGWCEASVILPEKVFKLLTNTELNNIKILNKETFYYPSYNETDKIFEELDININNDLLTLHYWNSYSEKYYNQYEDIDIDIILKKNTLYSKLLLNLYNNMTNEDKKQYFY